MKAFYDREYAEEQEARRKAWRNSPDHESAGDFALYRAGFWWLPERPSVRNWTDGDDEDF